MVWMSRDGAITCRKPADSRFTADGGGSWGTSYVVTNDWFNNLAVTYPSSFTFVLFPKGGGNAVQLLYNYPITVDDKGTVSAIYRAEGSSPYVSAYNDKITLADLSVTGTYDKKTGKINGAFTSHVIRLSTSTEYEIWAKGTFTGQMVKNGKSMTTYLEGSAYNYYRDQTRGSVQQGPYNEKEWFPWTAAAVVSQQTY